MSTTGTVDAYRYARLGSHLVCIDQPLSSALWTVLDPDRRLALSSLGISVRDTMRGLMVGLKSRLGTRSGYPSLPAFGHVAMPVHRGYKIFDLENHSVTKAFLPGTPEGEARAEIDVCSRISKIRAAPQFIAADPRCRWYTEEFIVGLHGTDSRRAQTGAYMSFYDDVERCLLELVGIEMPISQDSREYVENLAHDRNLAAWTSARVGAEALREILDFRDGLRDWLLRELPAGELQLVPSHGDFGLVNVIIAGDEFRVIDWEGTRHASLLADCFNFVFVEKYYGRAAGDVTTEMNDVADRYAAAVRERRPDLSAAADLPRPFAMRLYYLERLRLMLERDITRNLVSVIRKSIRMFGDFDRAAGYSPVNG